jgi:hypothetical protein
LRWTKIAMEPCEPRLRDPFAVPFRYRVVLPLVGDGRIALVQLRDNPARARVFRLGPDDSRISGEVHLVDGQWSFIWSESLPGPPPIVRFSAPRFLPGDLVCLRPAGRPLLLYQVSDARPALPFAGAG